MIENSSTLAPLASLYLSVSLSLRSTYVDPKARETGGKRHATPPSSGSVHPPDGIAEGDEIFPVSPRNDTGHETVLMSRLFWFRLITGRRLLYFLCLLLKLRPPFFPFADPWPLMRRRVAARSDSSSSSSPLSAALSNSQRASLLFSLRRCSSDRWVTLSESESESCLAGRKPLDGSRCCPPLEVEGVAGSTALFMAGDSG